MNAGFYTLANVILLRILKDELGPGDPRARALALSGRVHADLIGAAWFAEELERDTLPVEAHFREGDLVRVVHPNWSIAQGEALDPASLKERALDLAASTLVLVGEGPRALQLVESEWFRALETEYRQFRFVESGPVRRGRYARLLRKAVKDPELFLRDSRHAPLRWVARRFFETAPRDD